MGPRKLRYQLVAQHRATNKTAELPLMSERKEFDPTATTEDLLADLRRVQALFDGKHITRNLYRLEGKYSDSTWDSKFGTFAEFRNQAGLELSRGQQALERQIAKHSSADVYRGLSLADLLGLPKYEVNLVSQRAGLDDDLEAEFAGGLGFRGGSLLLRGHGFLVRPYDNAEAQKESPRTIRGLCTACMTVGFPFSTVPARPFMAFAVRGGQSWISDISKRAPSPL